MKIAVILPLISHVMALDATWTPGPDEDARGNSFSSRRRFAGMKPGERLPDYYYRDSADADVRSSLPMMMVSTFALLLLVVAGGWWVRAQVRQALAQPAVADAELVRQARLAKFNRKGD